jgi:hypothetical protein
MPRDDQHPSLGRRDFLRAAGAVGLQAPAPGDAIPMRPLGKTGVMVSAIGIGGHHLGEVATVEEALRYATTATSADPDMG